MTDVLPVQLVASEHRQASVFYLATCDLGEYTGGCTDGLTTMGGIVRQHI